MTEFSRRVDVHIVKDEPKTRQEFIEWAEIDDSLVSPAFVDESYERYLHYLQPYHWHAKSANGEIVAHGESYHNLSDCIHAIQLNYGDDTTMFWAPTFGEQRGQNLLRYGKTDRERQAAQ